MYYCVALDTVSSGLWRQDMADHTVILDALQGRSVEEVLYDVVKQQVTLIIRLPDGQEVVIAPQPHLKPLPMLPGRLPAGWKDALYARS